MREGPTNVRPLLSASSNGKTSDFGGSCKVMHLKCISVFSGQEDLIRSALAVISAPDSGENGCGCDVLVDVRGGRAAWISMEGAMSVVGAGCSCNGPGIV